MSLRWMVFIPDPDRGAGGPLPIQPLLPCCTTSLLPGISQVIIHMTWQLASHRTVFGLWTTRPDTADRTEDSTQENRELAKPVWYQHVQFSSVAQSCPTLCDPINSSTPGLPVHHQLPEATQTHVHWVSDAIQPSHPLSSPSSPALNLCQHHGLFQWVNSSHEVAKVLEFQL